jgi:hypothetical protein
MVIANGKEFIVIKARAPETDRTKCLPACSIRATHGYQPDIT